MLNNAFDKLEWQLIYMFQCNNGWAGDGKLCGPDPDQDGIVTVSISCTEPGCKNVSLSISFSGNLKYKF